MAGRTEAEMAAFWYWLVKWHPYTATYIAVVVTILLVMELANG